MGEEVDDRVVLVMEVMEAIVAQGLAADCR